MLRHNNDWKRKVGLALVVAILLLNAYMFFGKESISSLDTEERVEDLIREKVYGQGDLFNKPRVPADKVLVLTYSNTGLDVARAILSAHPDIWYVGSVPFDHVFSLSSSESSLAGSKIRAVEFVKSALNCKLNTSQLHLLRDTAAPHMCANDDMQPDSRVTCLNSLCKQRGLQTLAIKDMLLSDLESVVQPIKHRLKIILLQEPPSKSSDEDDESQRRKVCHRLMHDTERSAELEGLMPGIHTVYFIEDFARDWQGHAITMLEYVGLNMGSKVAKAAIKDNPIKGPQPKEPRSSPWIHVIESCGDFRPM